MYAFYQILDAFAKAGAKIYETFTGLWELLNTPINEFVGLLGIDIPDFVGDLLAKGALSYTPLELMIGAGLTFFIAYTIISWVIDILP